MKIILIVYDNESKISFFPVGLAYLASSIRIYYDVSIYNQDVYHYSEEHLTHFLDDNDFDVIGIGACGGYFQYRKVKAITNAIAKSKKKHFVVIGGHLVSSEPEYFLRKFPCNVICIGEGEKTIVDLLNTIENKKSLKNVQGIAFLENNIFIQTQRRPLIENIDEIPMPAYDLFMALSQLMMLRYEQWERP